MRPVCAPVCTLPLPPDLDLENMGFSQGRSVRLRVIESSRSKISLNFQRAFESLRFIVEQIAG